MIFLTFAHDTASLCIWCNDVSLWINIQGIQHHIVVIPCYYHMVAACKCTEPFGRSQRLEKLENKRILTKETKEGRTLYYAAVLVNVTLILHSSKTPHTSMSTSCLGPGSLKPTVPQNSPELYQTIGTLHKHCDCMSGIIVVLLEWQCPLVAILKLEQYKLTSTLVSSYLKSCQDPTHFLP